LKGAAGDITFVNPPDQLINVYQRLDLSLVALLNYNPYIK